MISRLHEDTAARFAAPTTGSPGRRPWGEPVDLTVDDVVKAFGDTPALHGVSLEIEGGELIALLGPSGSGKTTLLRVIAGLEAPTSGRVLFGKEDASARSVQERNVGFVFQHYALFRHMTVFDNVAFGLRVRPRGSRPNSATIRERVMTLLDLVQLSGLDRRYPAQLSGGQRQRVALARALAIEPRILLLDEPFGALDAKVRKELRRWLREIHDRTGHTTVFVTHDQQEALELADRVVIMSQGRIQQVGTPEAVYDHPETEFVYEFLGDANRIACTIEGGRAWLWDRSYELARPDAGTTGGAMAYVRPHDIEVWSAPGRIGRPAVVRQIFVSGHSARVELAVGAEETLIEAELSREHTGPELRPGQPVFVALKRLRVFPSAARIPAAATNQARRREPDTQQHRAWVSR